jgi:AraC-like DNA-binding protein
MVSIRCKLAVKSVLDSMGLHYRTIDLGEIEIDEYLRPDQLLILKEKLNAYYLELIDDRQSMLIEKIKLVVIEMIHYADDLPIVSFPEYLSDKLQLNYTQMANLFSEVSGTTLEQFIIFHKIEKVKELLVYGELTLKEIAVKLKYSSVAHLCSQFKKVTGLTPFYFKKLKVNKKIIRFSDTEC